jgi:hypothetical protein
LSGFLEATKDKLFRLHWTVDLIDMITAAAAKNERKRERKKERKKGGPK